MHSCGQVLGIARSVLLANKNFPSLIRVYVLERDVCEWNVLLAGCLGPLVGVAIKLSHARLTYARRVLSATLLYMIGERLCQGNLLLTAGLYVEHELSPMQRGTGSSPKGLDPVPSCCGFGNLLTCI